MLTQKMVDYVSLLGRLLALIELTVEYKRSRSAEVFQVVARIPSENLCVTARGQSGPEAKQRAAKELLCRALKVYHDDLLLALQVDKLSVLRQQITNQRE